MNRPFVLLTLLLALICSPCKAISAETKAISEQELRPAIATMSSLGTRVTGSEGMAKAAQYIEKRLGELGIETHDFTYRTAVRRHLYAFLSHQGKDYQLTPFHYNAITPQAIDKELKAPVYYVGGGSFAEISGKDLKDAIALLDFDSGRNWQLLASLGVRAIIYLKDDASNSRIFFTEKEELTPLQLPAYFMQKDEAEEIFGQLKPAGAGPVLLAADARIRASAVWENASATNIYGIIEGRHPTLKNELVILESFYDNQEFVAKNSPGADAASSIATFLALAKRLKKNPPDRSVLLVASSGQFQTLAGFRELIHSLDARSKDLRNQKRALQKLQKKTRAQQELLEQLVFPLKADGKRDALLSAALRQTINQAVDTVSRKLMQLRLQDQSEATASLVKTTAEERFLYRRLGWAEDFSRLSDEETELLKLLLPKARQRIALVKNDLDQQLAMLGSAMSFRSLVREYDEVAAVISLYLSSHGDGVGAFNRGWLHNLKPTINRTSAYSRVAEILDAAKDNITGAASLAPYQDSLRPSHLRSWDSWFLDRPYHGGEISSLAGFIGLSLVTTGDGRFLWGTPADLPERINWPYLVSQANQVNALVQGLVNAEKIHDDIFPRDGFVTATMRSNLLLQGELFANYPARKTTILGYQGLVRYYAMVDETGYFTIKGLADKKHVLDKLILEGYRFDEQSGEVIWAIDKKVTGKKNYRLKLLRKSMKADLVMFGCRQTTIFDLLEPRSFAHMTKIHLFDGRRDAPPEHYWWSRIDTRDSTMASIYTEPGTMLKLTLSDTVLTNKMILTNGSAKRPLGLGYLVDKHPILENTNYHAAKDAWTLLLPRIENLEDHGIFDQRINDLTQRGLARLEDSAKKFAVFDYSPAREAAAEALALAARVYVQVEKTQKDVLFGVLFYIALFVPFAFVMERFLFNFTNIYKRILGFSAILFLLILIIYNVHPAFELAYSPMVVILAFFIIGLSFMVTLIIFMRFEDEMILLQRRATHMRPEEISRWKAFTAAFFLGVSNLRRRRLRTVLTCTTLIILTFTIMSFTTIKSNQEQMRLLFQEKAPYKGLLLKKMSRQSLPPEATDILVNSMSSMSKPAPRVWFESRDLSRAPVIPLRNGDKQTIVNGLIGLSSNEAQVTGLDQLLVAGRWFNEDDRAAILLEEKTAKALDVVPGRDRVLLWGSPMEVVGLFAAESFERAIDLDGEPLTPVIFPDEAAGQISEEELEAFESGDDIKTFQSRYRHIPASQIAIIPAPTLLAAGGKLKNIALRPADTSEIEDLANQLMDRFNLAIFTGEEDGVWLYNLSDTINYSGVPNIIIPLLISVLIVLNTMISSVYERKGEIAVYTSVGLAPSHVAFLFVAEAMALAVVSVVLGYLVAQISAALLAATPLWAGITVNYSSMAGVAAMLLVIAVVLISVIYPSKVAARIAIPDVNRTFSLPEPVDNRICVTLPFLMKYNEHESIGGFIHDYLVNHQDISHGVFSTGPVSVVFSCSTLDEILSMVAKSDNPKELRCLHLRANVWLAPFDFGIMQTVDIQFCPAKEGEQFLEIQVTLHRRSGELAIWRRINTTFLHELRKQLLVWRSLDQETHRELGRSFRRITEKNTGKPQPEPPPQPLEIG